MKVLLFGKNGQVGWELQRTLAPLGELIALDRAGIGEHCGDLSNLKGIAETIRKVEPDMIVNAAAYTAVDKAESELELAKLINTDAPGTMAQEAAKLGCWLIHYSTDYVHDGSGNKSWKESDPTAPLNNYGQTKLAGERVIKQSGCNHILFRTSWVYGIHGNNFAKTMLHLAKERDQLLVIDDQVGVPTSAELIANVTARVLTQLADHNASQTALSGIYNLVPSGEISWCEYARFVIEHARNKGEEFKVQQIKPIPTSAYSTPAKRPLNSRLDTHKLSEIFAIKLPHWQEGIIQMLSDISGKEA
jgi:dTDP-4-dehydrorhamnose reductase